MRAINKAFAIAAIATAVLPGQDQPAQGTPAGNSYQYELTGGFSMSTTDTNPDIEQNTLFVGGTYHFAPVALMSHPWNEAAFLEHSMFATAGLQYFDLDLAGFEADGITYGLGYRYAAKDTKIAGEINFQTGTLDGDLGVDVDVTTVNLNAGYWLKDNLIVGVDFALDEIDPDGGGKFEETRYGVFGKFVHPLDEGRAINAEAHIGTASVDTGANDDDNFEVRLEGDFYFNPQTSVGAVLEFSSGDAVSEEGESFGVRGSRWFSPKVGVRAEYTMFWASDSAGADVNEFAIFVDMRF
jgi:hypothetical protein